MQESVLVDMILRVCSSLYLSSSIYLIYLIYSIYRIISHQPFLIISFLRQLEIVPSLAIENAALKVAKGNQRVWLKLTDSATEGTWENPSVTSGNFQCVSTGVEDTLDTEEPTAPTDVSISFFI